MTTTTTGYGPAAPVRDPLVVPLAPAAGWAAADLPRRACAVAALPLAAALALVVLAGRDPGGTVLSVWVLLGPTTFFALARVLRPERRSPERTPRHVLAAAATSYAVPVLAALTVESSTSDTVVIPFGSVAFLLGCTTVVWGLVALLVRAAR